jgi:PTH1 family peptidyl-tRNA hydrolase
VDVIDRLGENGFCRLRLGIGQPIGDPVSYVLSPFGAEEREVMESSIETAADATEHWIVHGPESTMNEYNG